MAGAVLALVTLLPVVFAEAASERPLGAADAAAGKTLYVQECAACHGERGDGKGPAAEHIDPKPRNFIAGPFKFRSTAAGQPPATGDLLRVLERGIPGTAMPPFAFLPEGERRKIAAYVLKLADVLDEPEPEPVKIEPASPPPASPESIARGKELFKDAGCASCHGETGKGDGPTAGEMKDDQGNPVPPRDLTDGRFRGGSDRIDVYTRLLTGLDGTPMPAYGDVLEPADLWAVVDYVMTLKAAPAAEELPADPIQAGRQIAAKYQCGGCHVLDDGRGGSAGPDLRISGQKLDPAWVERFLRSPRDAGKIYPWRPYRMPELGLSDDEARAMARYVSATGGGPTAAFPRPDPSAFPKEKVSEGKTLFVVTCAQCHSLGKVIETLPVNQQGPDLIRVADRVEFVWATKWLSDPKKIDPKTKMTIPKLTPEQIEAVQMFVWHAALTKAETPPADLARR